MPFGEFLEDFPAILFVSTHMLMIAIAIWAIVRTRSRGAAISNALWLYLASQPVFLAFWAGVVSLKMTAVTEQTLMMAMVVWLALGSRRDATRA